MSAKFKREFVGTIIKTISKTEIIHSKKRKKVEKTRKEISKTSNLTGTSLHYDRIANHS